MEQKNNMYTLVRWFDSKSFFPLNAKFIQATQTDNLWQNVSTWF